MEQLKTVISGRFVSKPEIDRLHEAFRDLGIVVLAPEKGWLYIPSGRYEYLTEAPGFRPLPGERHMTIRQIEDSFLACIRRADFVYLYNKEGLGESTGMELGFAIGCGKFVYAYQGLDFDQMEEYDLARRAFLREYVHVIPIEQIRADLEARRTNPDDLAMRMQRKYRLRMRQRNQVTW